MSSWFTKLWRRVKGDIVDIPGVVYSDEIDLDSAEQSLQPRQWQGNLQNVRLDTAPEILLHTSGRDSLRPGPEEVPYTFWERIGVVPIHPSRIRARQYYMPSTDFAMYDYDDVTPEERDLTARWMARVMEFNGAVPAGVLCGTACIVLPLHTVYRMPLLICAGATGVAIEIARSYMAAFQQRQNLDDFLLAKEIWYIKNVEVYQLGIPRIPKGMEKEYQSYVDPSTNTQTQQLPESLISQIKAG